MIARTPSLALAARDREVTGEELAWQMRAREFAAEVVHPTGRALDRIDAQAAVGAGSPVFDLLAQAHREGFTRLTDPRESGGVGLSRAAEYLVLEELATADAGLAVLLLAAPMPFRWAHAVGGERLACELSVPYLARERFDWSGCCAVGRLAGRVRATRMAAGWTLAGATAPAVPAAATATHALLACTSGDEGHGRPALAIVSLDRPGVVRSAAVDQLGMRTQARAQLSFDGVHLSRDELRAQPRAGASMVGAARALGHAAAAIAAVGIGRAAYEGTLRLAREQERDGRTLARHERAAPVLFRMFTLLGAARSITRAVHQYVGGRVDAGEGCSIRHAAAAHAFAADAAIRMVDGAMELCGPWADALGEVTYLDGATFHPERLLRDAQSYRVARPAGARPAPPPRQIAHTRRTDGIREDA